MKLGPVFSLGVPQQPCMHKITNRWKYGLNLSLKVQENIKRKSTFSCITLLSDTWNLVSLGWKITSFSKTTQLWREQFLTMFFYYQQLLITLYQVSFYADNYFELFPIVSSPANIDGSIHWNFRNHIISTYTAVCCIHSVDIPLFCAL